MNLVLKEEEKITFKEGKQKASRPETHTEATKNYYYFFVYLYRHTHNPLILNYCRHHNHTCYHQ